jgi:PAB-dependent poly(A)-specific ribonuclease subunit 2
MASYGSLIQSFNRWLLATFSAESIVEGETFAVRKPTISGLSLGPKESAIDQILGIKTRTTNTCSACDHLVARDGSLNVIDVQYLRKPVISTLTELLRSSFLRESSTKATCPSCKQFVTHSSRRVIEGDVEDSLPAVLSVNAMITTSEVFAMWQDKPAKGGVGAKHFMPRQISVRKQNNGELCFEEDGNGLVYDVTVCHSHNQS